MSGRRRLERRRRTVVWRDEDNDWLWACRACWGVGLAERDQQWAFEAAYRHASGHALVGFRPPGPTVTVVLEHTPEDSAGWTDIHPDGSTTHHFVPFEDDELGEAA